MSSISLSTALPARAAPHIDGGVTAMTALPPPAALPAAPTGAAALPPAADPEALPLIPDPEPPPLSIETFVAAPAAPPAPTAPSGCASLAVDLLGGLEMSSYVAQLTTNPAASAASTIAPMLCMVAFKRDTASPRVSAPLARCANPKHLPGHSPNA